MSVHEQGGSAGGGGESRPQQGGEGGTTRFGMEDGDNTDVPAAGGPVDEDKAGGDGSGG